MAKRRLKTLVLGLGNLILSDDGAGCRVAAELKKKIKTPDTDVVEASIAGLALLDLFTGYDKIIIVDVIQTKKGTPGKIYRLEHESLSETIHSSNPHDINIATALELGKKLKLKMPEDIVIFAIEAEDVTTFSEACTPAVSKAINECVEMVMRELGG